MSLHDSLHIQDAGQGRWEASGVPVPNGRTLAEPFNLSFLESSCYVSGLCCVLLMHSFHPPDSCKEPSENLPGFVLELYR